MAYFIPSSFQKRILRYALSRLELLDTDALDLEKLDLVWGKKTVIELRDVGLQLRKLVAWLNLPPCITLNKGTITLLRLTVPADLYASGILLEIEGVEAEASLDTHRQDGDKGKGKNRRKAGLSRGVKANMPRSNQPQVHDPGGHSGKDESVEKEGEEEGIQLPTTAGLAESFLQHEEPRTKEELELAMAKSRALDQSQMSDVGNDAQDIGLGTGLSLPAFLSDFLQGIVDRLQLRISRVQVDISMNIDTYSTTSTGSSLGNPYHVTFRLLIDSINVSSVSKLNATTSACGSRKIVLANVRGLVISDASLFSTLSQVSGPPSPAIYQNSTLRKLRDVQALGKHAASSTVSSTSSGEGLAQSSILLPTNQDTPSSQSTRNRIDSPDIEAPHQDPTSTRSQAFGPTASHSSPRKSQEVSQDDLAVIRNRPQEEEDMLDRISKHGRMQSGGLYASTLSNRATEPASPELSVNSDFAQLVQSSQNNEAGDEDEDGQHGSHYSSIQPDPYDSKRFAMAGSWDAPIQESSTLPVAFPQQERRTSSVSLTVDNFSGTPPFAKSASFDDLMESQFFSHEEAESMYVSAMSGAFVAGESSPSMSIDRAVHTQSRDTSPLHAREGPTSTGSLESADFRNGGEHSDYVSESETKTQRELDFDDSFTPNTAPESAKSTKLYPPLSSESEDVEQAPKRDIASQGSSSSHRSNTQARVVKEFLSIDLLSVMLPSPRAGAEDEDSRLANRNRSGPRQDLQPNVPGSFSTHSIGVSSYATGQSQPGLNSVQRSRQADVDSNPPRPETLVSVRIGEIIICGDIGSIKLMIMAGQQLKTARWDSETLDGSNTSTQAKSDGPQTPLELHVDVLSSKLVDVLRGSPETTSSWDTSPTSTDFLQMSSTILLIASTKHLYIRKASSSSLTKIDMSLQTFRFGYSSEDIISFDNTLETKDSVRDLRTRKSRDIIASLEMTQDSSKVNVTTLPLNLKLDLAQLDETFSWFGGLNGVLELGNSMMSTVTVVEPRPKGARPRGVRFNAPGKTAFVEQPSETSSETKLSARIGGLYANVQGKSSSLLFESTALKLVSRAEAVALQVDKIKFSGPHLLGSDSVPVSLDFINTRLEYLTYPKELDIDRLLNLLSPSRDKEEQDEGILLETLISQRQQGGVVRLSVEESLGTVSNPNCLDDFSVLAEEFAKLSTVAKYLPQDDRPGVLALCLVRKMDLNINVNSQFGNAKISASNVEVAQVTLPSLFLLAVNTIRVSRGAEDLVGEALPVDRMAMPRKVPSVGIRFVGDEMEPTVKVKLWNTRVDYHVSTLMAVMGLVESATGEIIVADMVSSIATLKARKTPSKLSTQSSFRSGKSSSTSRNMGFEVSIRDSALGLNPRKSPSRALFLLSDANIGGNLPSSDYPDTQGVLSINKASLMVIDNLESLAEAPQPDVLPTKFINQASQFMNLGYVSVCEISTAKVTWKVKPSNSRGEGSIEIEVRDELFVLETCADSTHTLQSVINGLNPPSPPNTALKYRTEVGPVQDMLASLSSEGFLSSRTVDADKGFPDGEDEVAVADDDTAGQLDLIESVFGLGLTDEEQVSMSESFLDDDFKNLAKPSAPQQVEERTLLENFHEQQQVNSHLEELEFHDDHFGTDSGKGKAHKWNSDRNTFETSQIRLNGIPFRLNVKDVHIIWNLYDGYDWQTTRDTISQAVADVEHKAAERLARIDRRKADEEDEESVIGDFLFNSIYIGIPANRDPRDLAGQVNRNIDDQASETGSYATSTTARSSPSRRVGSNPRVRKKRLRLSRSKRHKMSFELKGVSIDLAVFAPASSETQSSIDIRVEDLDIFDNVPTSAWRKFATYMHDAGQRQIGESMVHIEILTVKPVPDLAASEIVMTVKVLPLRLHVDQDALDFLTRFFEFKPAPTTPTPLSSTSSYHNSTTTSTPDLPFIQRAEIHAIPLKLDFKPKRVDYAGLRSGRTTEFMNFFILDQSNMVLRRCIVYGVSGFEKLGKTLNDIWMPDIKKTQLAGVLAGLAPVRSLVNVGGGVRELVEVPLREYQKDGRVLRSLSKGAAAFARTTTTEVARLGAKLAIGTQAVLQSAEDYFAPSAAAAQGLREGWEDSDDEPFDSDDDGTTTAYGGRVRHRNSKRNISLYSDPPANLAQGLRGAYRGLGRDLTVAKDAVVAIPAEVLESGSVAGGAKAVLRGAPMVILRPAIGVTRAVGKALQGATGSLDGAERRRIEDKYKRH